MKTEKYIKLHAQMLAKELQKEWSDEVASDLRETLSDFFDADRQLFLTNEEPKSIDPVKRLSRNASIQLHERLFNMFKKSKSDFVDVKPEDVKSSFAQLTNVARHINSCTYKKKNYPNVQIATRILSDRVYFYIEGDLNA